jgi:plastocyanin
MQTDIIRFIAIAGAAALFLLEPVAPLYAEQTIIVTIKDFDFHPMSLTVTAGATVTWKNRDNEPHTVTSVSGLFRSGALDTGETYSFKFDKPGTYKYVCTIHPRMTATIVVK